jgi:hypothetical protein
MPIDSVASHSPSTQLQPHDAPRATSGGKQDLLENVLQQLDRLLETLMRQLRSTSGDHAHSRHGDHHAQGHVSDQQGPQDTSTAGGGNPGNASATPPVALPHPDTQSSSRSASASSTPAVTAAGSSRSAAPATPSDPQAPTGAGAYATSVDQAAPTVHVKFQPVLRGDEQQKDAQIHNQADFGRAVDETAKEYGLNPNVFRAQLQVESGAFTQGYQKAMHAEGDLDRASSNNTSIGLGQISRMFLDGRGWADGGPGNKRVGGQVVTTSQYENSVTVQLRMAASNLAQRIADHGGLKQGLSYYVSGNDNPNNPNGASYIQKIDAALKDPAVLTPGR